ncbi:uncharacterized protein LOC135399929 [Ornithodoros turicata]|uniref:uncharacterized protein LOC135399929 n=1 Tax=Ornithodoros turicata TaxID=34597 RepID=UPI00313A4CCB
MLQNGPTFNPCSPIQTVNKRHIMKTMLGFTLSLTQVLLLVVLSCCQKPATTQTTVFKTLLRDRRQLHGVLRRSPLSKVRSRLLCTVACLREPQCVALNIRRDRGVCELLSAIGQLKQLLDEIGSEFLVDTRRIQTCADAPCKNGGSCTDVPISVKGRFQAYTCACPCGFCGSNCERLNFWRQDHSGIRGHNIPHDALYVDTLEACFKICMRVPGCKSVDFTNNDNSCNLNNVTHETAHLKRIEDVTYVAPLCRCEGPAVPAKTIFNSVKSDQNNTTASADEE